ncbi:MAG: hypothetical protein HOI35_09240 [Woeseia sp.]|jgi:hypothetical protein|nr:hypothetical protein [Woeseia sp.]MBT6210188.1 hypothetical protein [Woeseia sp.]
MTADHNDTVPTLSFRDRRVNPRLDCKPLHDNWTWGEVDATRSEHSDLTIEVELGGYNPYDNLV